MSVEKSIESLKQKLISVRASLGEGIAGEFPPASETDVLIFEAKHKIILPSEYRVFVTDVCNGGTDLFKLGEMDDGFDFKSWAMNDGFVGDLSKPFPFTEAWNDLSDLPGYDDERENDEQWLAEFNVMQEKFESSYFQATNGAIPIAHIGCAIRHWLVVTGAERGHVWEDDRANHNGFSPLSDSAGRRIGFLAWFLQEYGQ